VRVAVGDLVNIGVDTRVGWELHLRFNAVLEIRLGEQRADRP
jgi:hypothetical protein